MDHAIAASTENAMQVQARRYDDASSPYTSGDRIPVPPDAVELLRECISARKDDAALTEKIRAAAAIICDEAHRMQAMPEQLLVSIKELCHSLPEYELIRGARERDAFLSVVVTVAIEEYYRV